MLFQQWFLPSMPSSSLASLPQWKEVKNNNRLNIICWNTHTDFILFYSVSFLYFIRALPMFLYLIIFSMWIFFFHLTFANLCPIVCLVVLFHSFFGLFDSFFLVKYKSCKLSFHDCQICTQRESEKKTTTANNRCGRKSLTSSHLICSD